MHSKLSEFFRCFFGDASGATAIEYALIASVISIGIVASVFAFSDSATAMFDYIRVSLAPVLAGG